LTAFGDYELFGEIAHGGMGVVYRARQISLNRIVAVKMMLLGQLAGKAAFERFRAEAETVARLQHPNIVAIHEIGETDGYPFFSMDYVAGRNLAEVVRDRPLPARQAAGYMRTLAGAMAYAHSQGILHRDLKPANVLIDAFDEPRITDFGLAKRLVSDSSLTAGPTSLTMSGQVIGSPNFMPPEQAAGRGRKVGPASDIYGLGGLLYHLLTARPPFAAETFEATLVQVLESEPVAPRQLNPTIPIDLETICLKCLEKEPDRRYPAAKELEDDLDRFLHDQPIRARPLGPVGRVRRWCRRKPLLATLTGAVAALLLAVTAVSVTAAWRIAAEARHAEEQARILRLNLYVADMGLAYQALQEKNLGLAWELIQKHQPSAAQVVGARTRKTAGEPVEDLRGWEWRYLWGRCQGDSLATLTGHSSFVTCAVLSPDGATLATASFDQTVRIWDLATRQTRHCLAGFAGPIQRNSIAFSPDGAQFAVTDGAHLQIFDTTTWTRTRSLPNPTVTGRLYSVPIAFSPDGRTLACNANGERRLWDAVTWEPITDQPPHQVGDFGCLLTYSPNGRYFVAASADGPSIWDTSTEEPASRFLGILHWPATVVFSPDAQRVAAAGVEPAVMVWDVATGAEIVRLDIGEWVLNALAFSPDGRWLAVGGPNLELWDLELRTRIASLQGHYGAVWTLAFSADGRTLITGSTDGTARLWSVPAKIPATRPSPVGMPLQFSPDGRTLAVRGAGSVVEFWDVYSGNRVGSFSHPDPLHRPKVVAVAPDGQRVATVQTNGLARVWNRDSGDLVAELVLDPPPIEPWVVFSPDGLLLAISCHSQDGGGGGWTVVWDLQRRELHNLPGQDCYLPVFSPDGQVLATGYGIDIQLWTVAGLRPLATLPGQHWTMRSLAFSPDGTMLASSGRSRDIVLWDVATAGRLALLSANSQNQLCPAGAYSPDGRTLASWTGTVARVWNVATGRLLFSIGSLDRYGSHPIFSPDGNTLVVGGSNVAKEPAPIRVLRAPSWAEIDPAEENRQPSDPQRR